MCSWVSTQNFGPTQFIPSKSIVPQNFKQTNLIRKIDEFLKKIWKSFGIFFSLAPVFKFFVNPWTRMKNSPTQIMIIIQS